MEASAGSTQLVVGSRIAVGRDCATVRYVGPVEGQEGKWVGLEWDNPARGKHGGTTGGKQYFTCLYIENAGSFVRLNKLLPTATVGITMLEALRQRYQTAADTAEASASGSAEGGGAGGAYVETAGRRQVRIELVGGEKLEQQLADLKALRGDVVLEGMPVAGVGPPEELHGEAPNIAGLDLSATLFSDWREVLRLFDELKVLRLLKLSGTRIALPPQRLVVPWIQLHVLVMTGCCLTWPQVMVMEASLPFLEELHLCDNRIVALTPAPYTVSQESFTHLKVLDLENNGITAWSTVMPLAALPALERLVLGSNKISSISYADDQSGTGFKFQKLKVLLLGGNRIADWASVDALNRLPHLEETRLTDNAILADPKDRFEVIARMQRLMVLNAAEITYQERRDAELQYLRRCLGELEAATNMEAKAAVHVHNPRLPQLSKEYGPMAGSTSANSTAGTMAATLPYVKWTCHKAAPGKESGTRILQTPPGTPIIQIKVCCTNLFGIEVLNMTVHFKAQEDSEPIDLTDEFFLRPLDDFDVESGSEIICEQVDMVARRRQLDEALQREQEEYMQREKKQLKEGDEVRKMLNASRVPEWLAEKLQLNDDDEEEGYASE